MSRSQYLGQSARLRLLGLGGRSPSYQDVWDDETENMRKRLLSGPTVDIRVGPDQKHWSLHRNLLCHHSAYFETQLQVDKTAGTNGTKHLKLELPDDDPLGFELLVKWLYQGQLEDVSQMSDEAKYNYAVACHRLYLLCNRFDMVRLKNISMDQYRQCLNESQLVPDADEINDIYRASPAGSPFRSLMIQIAARQIMDPDVDRNAEAYRQCFESNPEFAVEMVNAIRSMSGGILFDDPTHAKHCTYHDHDDVSGCHFEGKGKASAIMAGAVNGQGLPATIGAQSKNNAILRGPLVELPVERRTPRKLHMPKRSPATTRALISAGDVVAQTPPAKPPSSPRMVDSSHRPRAAYMSELSTTRANIRSPRVPPKLERRGFEKSTTASIQSPLSTTRSALLSSVASPFDSTDTDPIVRHSAAMRIPHVDIAAKLPLSVRSGNQGLMISVNGVANHRTFVSPSLGKENRPPSRARLDKAGGLHTASGDQAKRTTKAPSTVLANNNHNRRFHDRRGGNGTDSGNGSTTSTRSRKRKMWDRTPKKESRLQRTVEAGTCGRTSITDGVVRPELGRSSTSRSSTISHATSRTASIASGPRKTIRVSSVVKTRNGNGGTTSIDGRRAGAVHRPGSGQSRRQPPKLRIGSQRT